LFPPAGTARLPVMKTYVTYGFIMAICSALLGMALHFTGFHSDVDKLPVAQKISMFAGLAISITTIVLAMKEKRSLTPATGTWGYGSALWTGVCVGFYGMLFGSLYNYAYFAFIDPNFQDVVLQGQLAAMEAQNVPSSQIEAAEPFIRKWLSPVIMTVTGAIFIFVWNLVISLIAAAFLKNRPAPAPAA
jgi:hypothetical protein